jgi:hypothetical protein
MVASADFAHNPIEFMRSHVVTCSKMPPGAQLEGKGRSRRQPMRVGAFDFYDRGVFELIYCRDETENTVVAYYCPYEDNEANYVFLGDEAEYMFTPSVSGCTFGIGSRTDKGGVLVGHANAKKIGTEQGREAQQAAQASLLTGKKGMGDAPRLISPTDYNMGIPDTYRGTIVGVRRSNYAANSSGKAWLFYTQTFSVPGFGHVRLRAEAIRAL